MADDPAVPSGPEGEAAPAAKPTRRRQSPPKGGDQPDLFTAAEGAEGLVNEILGREMSGAGSHPALLASAAAAKPQCATPVRSAAPMAKPQEVAARGGSWPLVLAILAIIMSVIAFERLSSVAARATALEQKLAVKADVLNLQDALEGKLALKADATLLSTSIGEIERRLNPVVAFVSAQTEVNKSLDSLRGLVGMHTDLQVELRALRDQADAFAVEFADLREELDGKADATAVAAFWEVLSDKLAALEAALAAAPKATGSTPQATTLPASSPTPTPPPGTPWVKVGR